MWKVEIETDEGVAERESRRLRSLRTCHRYAVNTIVVEEVAHGRERRRESGAYVPALSAALEDDAGLSDGARRCARKIAELTYRRNREGRRLDVTVSYLMKALGRSRRTVQRYLRVLEREGYIRVQVVAGRTSRMCVGLVVELCAPLFARHHRRAWPARKEGGNGANRGASSVSQNKFKQFSLDRYKDRRLMFSVERWAMRCMDGVFRAFMKTDPLGIAGR